MQTVVSVVDSSQSYGHSTLLNEEVVIALPGNNSDGAVYFFSLNDLDVGRSAVPLATWSSPEDFLVSPILTDDGSMLLAVGNGCTVWAIHASTKNVGSIIWKETGLCDNIMKISVPPLPLPNEKIVFVGKTGRLALLPRSNTTSPTYPTHAAGVVDAEDYFSQPPTSFSSGFLVVSHAGYATAFHNDGGLLWELGLNSSGVSHQLAGPPVYVRSLQRILIPFTGGYVCCISVNDTSVSEAVPPRACSGWAEREGSPSEAYCSPAPSLPSYSLSLTPEPPVLPFFSGMAVSPISSYFHGGSAFLLDSRNGVMWEVSLATGTFSVSTNSSYPWRVACNAKGTAGYCSPNPPITPVLVSTVGGKVHRNALMLALDGDAGGSACGLSSPALCVIALEVGDSGLDRDDDDSVVEYGDDDGGGTVGLLWSKQVLLPQSSGASAPLSLLPYAALSITPSGTLLVPTSSGLIALRYAGHPRGPESNAALLVGITLGSVGAGVLGLCGAFACVAWRRKLRRQREAILEELEYNLLGANNNKAEFSIND